MSNYLNTKWKETHTDYLEAFLWNLPTGLKKITKSSINMAAISAEI